jgi:4-amino-4-deoxy-L-arabinose transferase-like glycosyltransferase
VIDRFSAAPRANAADHMGYHPRMHTTPRRALFIIALVALVHAAIFAVYQRPEWGTSWEDQVGYQRLGHVLATTGAFTRNPDARPFAPETIRTPGYPLFVAAVYRLAGESHAAVAAAQALLFALLTLVTFALTARLATGRVALAAAAFTALFAPIPYYGALVLTEVLCTVLVTIGMWLSLRAVQEHRTADQMLTGVFFGFATLTRPNFVLLPVAIAGSIALVEFWRGDRRRVSTWGWMLAAFAIVLAPWIAYNVVYVHRWTISPAGGLGRATWEASWQGTWPGRVQADLTRLAETHITDDDQHLDRRVLSFAAANDSAPEPMLRYVHQWRDIRRIWDTPTDPRERSLMRVAADDEYWRVGLENIRQDRVGHVLRRITIGTFVLWAAEIPIRYSHINTSSRLLIRGFWFIQAVAMALALLGLVLVAWRRGLLLAAPLAALLAYITAVHVPMLAEARYSLPAKPVVLALAAIALAELLHRLLPDTGDYLP